MENLQQEQKNLIKNNQVYFNVKDGKVSLKARGPICLEELILIVSTGLLSAMKTLVMQATDAEKESVKKDLYDMYNIAASNTLTYFAPELEKHTTLTEQAILNAENEIINAEHKKMKADKNYRPPSWVE